MRKAVSLVYWTRGTIWFSRLGRNAAAFAVILLPWFALHLYYGYWIIYHDSWKHIFPFLFNIIKQSSCGNLPHWLGMVDNGSPTFIYLPSFSLTQIMRAPWLYVMSCIQPDWLTAAYWYKAQIYLAYGGFACGMYVLGRLLYRSRLSAVYLFGATLFAGLCLQSSHSNHVTSELFWVPWIVSAMVLFHREPDARKFPLFFNFASLFLCLALLDHYPHLPALAAALGLFLYLLLAPGAFSRLRGRVLLRLWPALIAFGLTGVQLLLLQKEIVKYAPGLRAGITVDPSQFGATGFVQPSALISSFFPFGFFAGFESICNVTPNFIYDLDSMIFYPGILPLTLAIAFIIHPGNGRLRTGWVLFAAGIFLIALQQTQLYLLLFRLPSFDLFRGYFLFIVYVVFAILVMSGYGMDIALNLPQAERRVLLYRSLGILLIAAFVAGAALLWMVARSASEHQRPFSQLLSMIADSALIVSSGVAVWFWARTAHAGRGAMAALAVLVLTQAAYGAALYESRAVHFSDLQGLYGLDAEDLEEPSALRETDPNRIMRKPCEIFAQCYVSSRDVVSINSLPFEGSFLRNRDEPLFRENLAPPVIARLSGLGRGVFWTSREISVYDSDAELVDRLNQHAFEIGGYLSQYAFIARRDLGQLQSAQGGGAREAVITRGFRAPDEVRISYAADGPAFLNAAVSYDSHWKVFAAGREVSLLRGDFSNILVPLDPGKGEVLFIYANAASRFVLWSRYFLLLAAVAAVIVILRAMHATRQTTECRGNLDERSAL